MFNIMKNFAPSLLFILCLSLNLLAQTNFHLYPIRPIADVIALNPAEQSEKADIVISANPFPSKTSVIYTGKSRPVGEDTRNFISLWVETRNVPPENAKMLVDEFLFIENGREYWMPVHIKTAPKLKNELKAGDDIIIYYFFLGGYNPKKLQEKRIVKDTSEKTTKDKIEWIFAVEIFQKSDYQTQSLAAAIDKKLEYSGDRADFLIDSRQVKSKSKVIYTGEVRNASEKKILFLKRWAEKIGAPSGVVELMSQETRFREGEKDYWFPVRKSILEEMRQRLKKGESVEIHTILAGGIPQTDSFEWVFIVGEFTR